MFALTKAVLPATVAVAVLLSGVAPASLGAQDTTGRPKSYHFQCGGRSSGNAIPLRPGTVYSPSRGYGFRAPLTGATGAACAADQPFLFDVALGEGNYDVSVTLGDSSLPGETTVRAESRRLMLERVHTNAGQFVTRHFTVNVRTAAIAGGDSVRLKPREIGSATWDDRLTLEFTGVHPSVRDIEIHPAMNPVTVFLAGNSTVVDQTLEPWAAWGQMIPRFFKPGSVVVANHAESGETLKAFIGERRLAKVLSTIKKGDYLFIEFAHNDQKPGSSYLEPFTTYKEYLRRYIAEARSRGATPVLVTSMHRRQFDSTGHIVNTLGDYPAAVRQVAAEDHVALVDLNAMSKDFYQALGPERAKKAFVHYPAGSYPGQVAELKDDTHFNNYGAYELARMVVEGLQRTTLPLAAELLPDLPVFDPSHPDAPEQFALPPSPVVAAPESRAPVVPSTATRPFDVRAFGAKGDGRTIDSDAINRAIESAALAGGGTVYFSAGNYATYSVRLRSHVGLFLDQGATLLAADSGAGRGYDPAEAGPGNTFQDFGHSHFHNSLIWGENVEDVSITGRGRIDGRGLSRGLGAGASDLNTRPGEANKAIALKLSRNVLLRDFTIFRGGHMAILATGVDNLTIDNLSIDTNRDGIDVDNCRNVRISNVSVNAPNDDAIVLKSSFALGAARATENVTITNSFVSGFDVGTMLDGTFGRTTTAAPDRDGPTGRIKLGTESNGAFRNITISNVVFNRSRGLALETVDGALLEDVTISNITMREVSNAPLFLRLASRMRGPAGTPVGRLRRVSISNVVVYDADPRYASIIAGIPGHPVEDVSLSNVRIWYRGGLSLQQAALQPPELVNTFFRPPGGSGPRDAYTVPERAAMYPEPSLFGLLPAYGFYIRHAAGIRMSGVEVGFMAPDTRPAFVLDDVRDVGFHGVRAQKSPGVPTFVLRDVAEFRVAHSRPVPDMYVKSATRRSF